MLTYVAIEHTSGNETILSKYEQSKVIFKVTHSLIREAFMYGAKIQFLPTKLFL